MAEAQTAEKPAKSTGEPPTAADRLVGTIVHYFSAELADASRTKFEPYSGRAIELNKQGAGPYPAMVVQQDGRKLNLRVFAFGGDWIETDVEPRGPKTRDRYWVDKH